MVDLMNSFLFLFMVAESHFLCKTTKTQKEEVGWKENVHSLPPPSPKNGPGFSPNFHPLHASVLLEIIFIVYHGG